jgi:hypothetical protein
MQVNTMLRALEASKSYLPDSIHQKRRLDSSGMLLAATSTPSRLVDSPEFRHFCHTMDPKFAIPGSAKMESVQQKLFDDQKKAL